MIDQLRELSADELKNVGGGGSGAAERLTASK
jgi:hypothetical protein